MEAANRHVQKNLKAVHVPVADRTSRSGTDIREGYINKNDWNRFREGQGDLQVMHGAGAGGGQGGQRWLVIPVDENTDFEQLSQEFRQYRGGGGGRTDTGGSDTGATVSGDIGSRNARTA
jgi:hypothetical protein